MSKSSSSSSSSDNEDEQVVQKELTTEDRQRKRKRNNAAATSSLLIAPINSTGLSPSPPTTVMAITSSNSQAARITGRPQEQEQSSLLSDPNLQIQVINDGDDQEYPPPTIFYIPPNPEKLTPKRPKTTASSAVPTSILPPDHYRPHFLPNYALPKPQCNPLPLPSATIRPYSYLTTMSPPSLPLHYSTPAPLHQIRPPHGQYYYRPSGHALTLSTCTTSQLPPLPPPHRSSLRTEFWRPNTSTPPPTISPHHPQNTHLLPNHPLWPRPPLIPSGPPYSNHPKMPPPHYKKPLPPPALRQGGLITSRNTQYYQPRVLNAPETPDSSTTQPSPPIRPPPSSSINILPYNNNDDDMILKQAEDLMRRSFPNGLDPQLLKYPPPPPDPST